MRKGIAKTLKVLFVLRDILDTVKKKFLLLIKRKNSRILFNFLHLIDHVTIIKNGLQKKNAKKILELLKTVLLIESNAILTVYNNTRSNDLFEQIIKK